MEVHIWASGSCPQPWMHEEARWMHKEAVLFYHRIEADGVVLDNLGLGGCSLMSSCSQPHSVNLVSECSTVL